MTSRASELVGRENVYRQVLAWEWNVDLKTGACPGYAGTWTGCLPVRQNSGYFRWG